MAAVTLHQDLPVVLLKVWSRNRAAVDELAASWRLPPQEFAALDSGLFALLPGAGEAELVEAAHMLAQRIFGASAAGSEIQALVFLGSARKTGDEARIVPDLFLEDIREQKPQLFDRTVLLTSHAIRELESQWTTEQRGTYQGPSGRSCPLFALLRPEPSAGRWKNPRLLGRITQLVEREQLDRISEASAAPAFVVRGGYGAGKTRAVAATRLEPAGPQLWVKAWTSRSGGPSLSQEIANTLSTRGGLSGGELESLKLAIGSVTSWSPNEGEGQSARLERAVLRALPELPAERSPTIVCDDLHRLRPADSHFLQRLLEHPALGSTFRLALIGRPGGDWGELCSDLETIEIGPMEGAEAEALWTELVGDLSLPTAVQTHFFDLAGGSPLVLEDSLLQLARRRLLKQLYGNFFYSGPKEVQFEATSKFTRGLQAEVHRVGPTIPLHVLASADAPLPVTALSQVAGQFDAKPPVGWEDGFVECGLVVPESADSETVLRFRSEACQLALRASIRDESLQVLRGAIADALGGHTGTEEMAWQRYELLAGTQRAIPALIEAARASATNGFHRELFEAARTELEHHRRRNGDNQTELELLWIMLPLARRLGVLRNLEFAIDRALELTEGDHKKQLALITLKAEHAQNAGQLQEAEQCLIEGLRSARGAAPARQALLLIQLGKLLYRQERLAEARKLLEDLLGRIDNQGNPALAASCHFHLGNIDLQEHRLEPALDHHQLALRARKEHGLDQHVGSSLASMGALNLAHGNYPRALKLFEEAEEVLEQFGEPGEAAYALLGIGRARSRLGDFVGASQPLRRALELRTGLDDQIGEAIARLAIAENQLRLGNVEQALRDTRRARFKLVLIEAARYVGDAERLLGRIQLKQRQFEQASSHFLAAFEQHRSRGHLLESTFDRAWLLEAALALEDPENVDQLSMELERVMKHIRYPELGERLDLRLYLGLRWLDERGTRRTTPLAPLERAYGELCRKTEILDPALRNRFLFQIPDNRAIVDAATLHGLTTQSVLDL